MTLPLKWRRFLCYQVKSSRHFLEIKIGRIEFCLGFKAFEIENSHALSVKSHKTAFAKIAQNPVGMNHGKAQTLTKLGLVHWQIELQPIHLADRFQAKVNLAKKLSRVGY